MQLAMIGLGRMGGNMVERLMRHGHKLVVFDRNAERVAKYKALGATPAERSRGGRRRAPTPRVIWIMVPAGRSGRPDDRHARAAAVGRRHHHRRRQLELPRLDPPRRRAREVEDRVHRRGHERRDLGPRERLLPDGRRQRRGGEHCEPIFTRAGAGRRLRARRTDRRRPLREDGAQRRSSTACSRRTPRDTRSCTRPRPSRSSTWSRSRTSGSTAASCARGSTSSPAAAFARDASLVDAQGLGRRFGRRTLDGAGSDRPRRPRAGDHAVAAHALPLAPGRLVRRQGDRGAAQRVRRTRGEDAHDDAPRRVISPVVPRIRRRRSAARRTRSRASAPTRARW